MKQLEGQRVSSEKGSELLGKTTRLETRFARIRFLIFLVVFSIPFGLLGFFILLLTLFVRIFSDNANWLLFLEIFVAWAWIANSYKFAYMNVHNSKKPKDMASTQWAIGARMPSERETDRIDTVFKQLMESGHGSVQIHENYFIIDNPTPQAFTLGKNAYITRAAVDSEYLPAILGHEIAHLNLGDGDVLLSLRSFTYPFIQYRLTGIGNLSKGAFYSREYTENSVELVKIVNKELSVFLFAILFGGFAVLRYQHEWAEWFRERDYYADEYVIKLGLGQQLQSYLEEYKDLSIAVPYSQNWMQFNELRIDRVLALSATPIYN